MHIICVLFFLFLQAEPETKTRVQVVYFGNALRSQKRGSGKSKTGERKSVRVFFKVTVGIIGILITLGL